MALVSLLLLLLLQATSSIGYIQTYPDSDSSFQMDNQSSVPLYIGLIMSFGGAFNSSGTLPGIQVALDLINSEPGLLPGYSLRYTATDSQVNVGRRWQLVSKRSACSSRHVLRM